MNSYIYSKLDLLQFSILKGLDKMTLWCSVSGKSAESLGCLLKTSPCLFLGVSVTVV